MKKGFSFVAVALICTATQSTAYLGQFLSSFPAPASGHRGLGTNVGEDLYVVCLLPNPYVYRINDFNGSIYQSYRAPFGSWTDGAALDHAGYLWVTKATATPPALLGRCDAATGSIVVSFPIIEHKADGGVAVEATSPYYVICNTSGRLTGRYRYSTGSLVSTFSMPHASSTEDPCFDSGNDLIWFPDASRSWVYGYTTNGSFVKSFSVANYIRYPNSSTYKEGKVWLSSSRGSYICVFDCPVFVGAEPASLGRVKALFR